MKTVGIIAEFNPFHNGHKYLIEKAKRITGADTAVIICSGNYVQRGIPSIYDKTFRAKAAVLNGADVIFELPVVYSTASAETFARAAVRFLDKLNCIDYLCFGVETDNIKALPVIASILNDEPEEYKDMLNLYLKTGLSYPKARSRALTEYCSKNNIINKYYISQIIDMPNNILAIEYLKSLKYFNSKIKPVAIKRLGADYNSTDLNKIFASATGIRNQIETNKDINKFVPENCLHIYSETHPINIEDYSNILGYKLLLENDFSKYEGISEDLSNRINNYKSEYTGIISFSKNLQAKNYTYSAISRSLIHILLDIKKSDVIDFINNDYIEYGILLAFNRNSNILSVIKEQSDIEIVSKYSAFYNLSKKHTKKMLDINLKADELYRMLYMSKFRTRIPDEFERQIFVI